ncbi:MAG: GtrA family protein [Candidatus Colwellbacteria bacterium]|nr:GtrA family protein [Candidatus Colwellbacteria bacterium]MBI3274181.1 GtrA family protein [Candidatus Colwellbacteria bacterium]
MDNKIIAQLGKFIGVGLVNTFVDFAVLNSLIYVTGVESGRYLLLLNSISFLVAVANSYFMNKYWTFNADNGGMGVQAYKFLTVSLVGAAINSGFVYGITTYITPPFESIGPISWVNMAKVVATGASLIWNFLGYKFIVFRK